ncbi:hypothetical protein GCM10010249_15940 [Streptomyces roseolilacinus]|uniref:Uncharacterized protein n=1 Tax=Streptomyces roseolilacinus TaxID=66904 RepID=A0A918AXT4_9ACTN|nr:hypothetical protein GCM10010249_15940 [Streptomyces roseolilacinus]
MREGAAPGAAPSPPFSACAARSLRLHRLAPDAPLPCEGEPYPDDGSHRRRQGPRAPRDRRSAGRGVALVLDAHLAQASAHPGELADAFHDVHVPIHRNEHIAAAAERATGNAFAERAAGRPATGPIDARSPSGSLSTRPRRLPRWGGHRGALPTFPFPAPTGGRPSGG